MTPTIFSPRILGILLQCAHSEENVLPQANHILEFQIMDRRAPRLFKVGWFLLGQQLLDGFCFPFFLSFFFRWAYFK